MIHLMISHMYNFNALQSTFLRVSSESVAIVDASCKLGW